MYIYIYIYVYVCICINQYIISWTKFYVMLEPGLASLCPASDNGAADAASELSPLRSHPVLNFTVATIVISS